VLDLTDPAAGVKIAATLIAEAGGTRAAASDLPAALDDAESDAGARGPVAWLVVNPTNVPHVRRALAPTFYDARTPRSSHR
jgi:hypothetical protein